MNSRTTRRRLLASSAAIGLATVAGCTDADEGGDPVWGTGPDEEGEDADSAEEAEDDLPEDVDYEDPDGEVAFVEPEDGAEVTSPVEVEMDAEDFEVRPDGDAPQQGAGHLHLLVDEDPVEPREPIPFEEGYVHYGDGELEDELELEPGEYDLVCQASDDAHVAYAMTDERSITVLEE